MYLIVFVMFSKHFGILSQYLVMYLVPGAKGLPGGVDLACHTSLDPPGYNYGMQSTNLGTQMVRISKLEDVFLLNSSH